MLTKLHMYLSSCNSLHQHHLVAAHQYWLQPTANDFLLVHASVKEVRKNFTQAC